MPASNSTSSTVSAFQSTLSVRRATNSLNQSLAIGQFQSTLSVRRATRILTASNAKFLISIHALRKESDAENGVQVLMSNKFQSTLSVRRATGLPDDPRMDTRFQSTLSVRRATRQYANT